MMTKQEAIEKHRGMWKYIVDQLKENPFVYTNSGKSYLRYVASIKQEYLEDVVDDFHNCQSLCYCCEYSDAQEALYQEEHEGENIEYNECRFCPLNWESNSEFQPCMHKNFFGDEQGYYGKLLNSDSIVERLHLSKKILNLKESEDK